MMTLLRWLISWWRYGHGLNRRADPHPTVRPTKPWRTSRHAR